MRPARVDLACNSSTAPIAHNAEATRNGTFQPYALTRYASAVGEIAPPILPHMFMTDDTEPAQSPPISRGIAQETPTVISSPKNAMQDHATQVCGSCGERGGNDSGGGEEKSADRDHAARSLHVRRRAQQHIGEPSARQIAHGSGEQRQARVESHVLQIVAAILIQIGREPIEIRRTGNSCSRNTSRPDTRGRSSKESFAREQRLRHGVAHLRSRCGSGRARRGWCPRAHRACRDNRTTTRPAHTTPMMPKVTNAARQL